MDQKLEEKMQAALPQTGALIEAPGSFMECMDPANLTTWMTLSPVSLSDFKSWTPGSPLIKTGIGKAAMDMAAFRHDPAGPGRSVQVKAIDGFQCLHVATPASMPDYIDDGLPALATVTKAHTLGFEAGRTIKIMTVGDEHFVEVIGDALFDERIKPAPGGKFFKIELNAPWVVELPFPATTYFWRTKTGPRSFQGPVQLPAR